MTHHREITMRCGNAAVDQPPFCAARDTKTDVHILAIDASTFTGSTRIDSQDPCEDRCDDPIAPRPQETERVRRRNIRVIVQITP
jgi:hypothetical protein